MILGRDGTFIRGCCEAAHSVTLGPSWKSNLAHTRCRRVAAHPQKWSRVKSRPLKAAFSLTAMLASLTKYQLMHTKYETVDKTISHRVVSRRPSKKVSPCLTARQEYKAFDEYLFLWEEGCSDTKFCACVVVVVVVVVVAVVTAAATATAIVASPSSSVTGVCARGAPSRRLRGWRRPPAVWEESIPASNAGVEGEGSGE